MDISQAKRRVEPRRDRKRVGRGAGSGRGRTSGRGHKGARSRSGWSSRGMTGGVGPWWRRLPKRGFSNAPFKRTYSVVNVGQLGRFPAGSVVTPDELRKSGLVKQVSDGGVKILGEGELDRPLTVRADAFSGSAVAKIEATGGTVERIPGPKPPVRRKMKAGTTAPDLTP